jgi:predicted metal-dependent phosphoesterase TrpH
MSWRFVGHVHTRRSPDCMTSPESLVRAALRLGIDVLAVTDHDTWQGAVDVLGVVAKTGAKLRVVIASEVSTDQGDVIGLFLRDDVRVRPASEFCDRVHAQGGLVLLPHPYKWHRLDDKLLSRVDLVEVHNSRTPRPDNARAAALASERRLPALVGPDAHRTGELGLAINEFDGELPADEAGLKRALVEAPRRHLTAPASIWNEWRSQAVKLSKVPDRKLAWWLLRGAVRRLVKPREYEVG